MVTEILAKEAIHLLVVLYILLAVIVLLLILLLTCLFIPLSYKIDAVFEQLSVELSFSLRNCGYGFKASWIRKKLYWHLLLFKWPLNLKKKSSANQQAPHEPLQSNMAASWPELLNLALDSGWREPAWHILGDMWRIVRPRLMMIKARIGFDEPHYTGWMLGLAGILQKQNSSYSINLEGVWDEPCCEGQVMVSGKICLALLFWQLLKFFLQPEIRAHLKQWRKQTSRSHPQAA